MAKKSIRKQENNSRESQGSLKGYFIAGTILVLFFAYLIAKDATIPHWLILILGVFGSGFLLFKSIGSPELVLLILVCYLPFSKFLVGDFNRLLLGLNLTNILTIFIFTGWFFKSKENNFKFWDKNELNSLLYIFIFMGFLSLINTCFKIGEDYLYLFIEFKRWISPIIFYFLAYNIVREKSTAKVVTYIMMFAVFIVGLMAIRDYLNVGYISMSKFDELRIGGIADQPNQLAAFFVSYMFLYAGFILVYIVPRYWLLLVPMATTFGGLMVTFSRGGYISFVAGCLGIAFFKSKFLFILMLFIMVIMAMNPSFLPPKVRYRMETTFTEDSIYKGNLQEELEPSASKRIEAWKGAIAMIGDNPFFGVGYGMFPYFLPKYNPAIGNMDAHNTYLIMATEQGVFSVIVFLLIIFILIRNASWILKNTNDKFYKALALGFLGGVAGILTVNIFGSRLNALEISGYFWILAGMIMRIRKKIVVATGLSKNAKN